MDILTLPMSSPRSLKRSLSDAGLETPSMDNVGDSVAMVSQETSAPSMEPSPASPSNSTINSAPAPSSTTPQTSSTSNVPQPPRTIPLHETNAAKKRPKLTASEKEAKRLEKEAKEKEKEAKEKGKAEQKAKKEEEKLRKEKEKEEDRIRKEQEKARKDEDKRAKDAEKEKKRLEKDEEKRKKEEEQNKKQKSQLRLNAFFARPSLPNDGSTPSPTRGSQSPATSRRSSITSIHDPESLARERSVTATPSKPKRSEYERRFPSFFLHSSTTLAPHNRFDRDDEGLQYARKVLDDRLASGSIAAETPSPFNPQEMLHLSPYKRRRLNKPQPSVKDIVERLHGTYSKPIDLTGSQRLRTSLQPLDALKSVSTKILRFAEDVRPPYAGTYSRVRDPSTARKICRNPFSRGLPSTDYDYDSEAEWEDPGEGEDLDSEGEEEVESEDGDEMEGFLDDEEDGVKTGQKRRLLAGDLEPTSTGLCWEDAGRHLALQQLASYGMEVILGEPLQANVLEHTNLVRQEHIKTPIDPYSTAYWQDSISSSVPTASSRPSQSTMDPPRIPLNTTNRNNFLLPTPAAVSDRLKPQQPASLPPMVPQAPKRAVTAEVLEDFKRAVEGSDLTKAGLVEVLKKQFPKQSKDAIKDTLTVVAERVGTREKDKRWVVKR
ncbi:MAG: hypothetical protein L6R39_003028 [Caloplaca ligustica]|nr:MAG: hypothetical protein L6R39_003028 [Caloplaca ligustica]